MNEKGEIIYAFIDSQNLNLSVSKDVHLKNGKLLYHGWKLSFKRFFTYIRDKYKVDKAFLFIGRVEKYQNLYLYLQEVGYFLIFKPTLVRDGIIKGNVDAELVLHSMIEYPNYQKAIIVAGDGDYRCLIEYLAEKDKLLRVLIPNRYSYSSLLDEFKSFHSYISDLRPKLEERT